MCCKTKSLSGNFFRHTGNFKHYTARLNNCYPIFKRSFTGTHTCFSRFCSYWFIWENFDPNFTTTFDVTCHSDTGCLDLV